MVVVYFLVSSVWYSNEKEVQEMGGQCKEGREGSKVEEEVMRREREE